MEDGDLTEDEVAQMAEEMRQRGRDCDAAESRCEAEQETVDGPWDMERGV
jgi:hypothetical protein